MCRSHSRFGSFVLTFVASGALLALACGGSTSSVSNGNTDAGPAPGTDGGGSDGGGGGTTVGPRAPGCPPSAPTLGTSCSKDGLYCEYGDDFNPECNTVVICTGNWGSPISYGGGPEKPKCGAPPPKPGPNPSACPASADSAGQTCGAGGTVCNYPGKQCTCQIDCPQYPVGHECPDAGTTWVCLNRVDSCSTPRPSVGSPCTAQQEGQTCGLADPTECGQEQLSCEKGTWKLRAVNCPISTATAKKGIHYLDDGEVDSLKAATLSTKLATYRYKEGDESPHLGFIIEDQPPGSPAVTESRRHVDLYGYVSMTVATLQAQQRELAALREEVRTLKKTCAEPIKTRK